MSHPSKKTVRVAVSVSAILVILVARCGVVAGAQKTLKRTANQGGDGSILRSRTNLVRVRVVVRDAKGNAVSGLTRSDFRLFDDKKPRTISYFLAEAPPPSPAIAEAKPSSGAAKNLPAAAAPPHRFTALFFDDYHIQAGDLIQIREAAKRYLGRSLDSGERVAISSASGNVRVGLTNDRDKLEQGLSRVVLAPRFAPLSLCPQFPIYLAQRVEDMDPEALATAEAMEVPCKCPSGRCSKTVLEEFARGDAKAILRYNDQGAAVTIGALEDLVQQMAKTPGGDRTIALVSDGFINEDLRYELGVLIDHALRVNVVINALDTRGLYVDPVASSFSGLDEYAHQGMRRSSDVLLEAAEGTGGIFVQNTNDMESGLTRIGALHTASYVLGFAPQNVKLNGQFHTLKVKLANSDGYTVQARRGYFAPKKAEDFAKAEKDELESAVFSADDLNALPVRFSSTIAKVNPQTSKLSVTADVDIDVLRFREADSRNLDQITFMLALFDGDGNYVSGEKKTVNMRLSGATLRRLKNTGASLTATVTVKSGSYLVRGVLLDANSQRLGSGTENITVP
ncbi:MAG: VWA domain-containing protein [Candidatus Acidiferrales bacterium]